MALERVDEEFTVASAGGPVWGGFVRSGSMRSGCLTFVLSHGLTNSHEDAPLFGEVAGALLAGGHDVVVFDYQGSGRSAGSFEDKTFGKMRQNLGDVLHYIAPRVRTGSRSLALFGRSVGGTLAAFYAAHQDVWTTILVSPPFDLESTFRPTFTQIGEDGFVRLDPKFKPSGQLRGDYRLRPEFYEELQTLSDELRTAVLGARRLLILQGDADAKIAPDQGQRVYELAAEPKRYIVLAGGTHDYIGMEGRVTAELLKWLDDEAP